MYFTAVPYSKQMKNMHKCTRLQLGEQLLHTTSHQCINQPTDWTARLRISMHFKIRGKSRTQQDSRYSHTPFSFTRILKSIAEIQPCCRRTHVECLTWATSGSAWSGFLAPSSLAWWRTRSSRRVTNISCLSSLGQCDSWTESEES